MIGKSTGALGARDPQRDWPEFHRQCSVHQSRCNGKTSDAWGGGFALEIYLSVVRLPGGFESVGEPHHNDRGDITSQLRTMAARRP